MALTTDIEVYYKLDTNNSTQPDSVGSNDGTVTGATYTASGKINGAYSFDATTEKIVLDSAITFTGAFTISFWGKPNSYDSIDYGMAMASSSSASYSGLRLVTSSDKLLLSITGSERRWDLSSNIVGDGNWHHFVFTRNASNIPSAWIDGVDKGVLAECTGTASFDQMARYQNSNGYSWNGLIDEMGLWSRELTDTEIGELYNSGSGLTYPFSTGENIQINIGDVWKDVASVKINIGDTWKDVSAIKQNIGDSWKTV